MVQQPTGLHETQNEIRGTLDQPQDTMLVLVVTLQEIPTVMVAVTVTPTVETRMEEEMNFQLQIKEEEEEVINPMADPLTGQEGVAPDGPPAPQVDLLVLEVEEEAETRTEMMVAHHHLMLELLAPTSTTSSKLNGGCLRSISGCNENHNKKTAPKQER